MAFPGRPREARRGVGPVGATGSGARTLGVGLGAGRLRVCRGDRGGGGRPVRRRRRGLRRPRWWRGAFAQGAGERFYLGFWDNGGVRGGVVVAVGPGGSRRYRTTIMDLPARTAVDSPVLL